MNELFNQEAANACMRFSEMCATAFMPKKQNENSVETVQENIPPQPTLASVLSNDEND